MPGPPPQPAERKRRLGNPGKRALPDVATVTTLPALPDDTPENLGDAGASMWNAVTTMAKSWLAQSDHIMLRLLCELADQREDLRGHIAEHGYTIIRPDGHMVGNPTVVMLSDVEKRMTHISSLLGLTPADRTRIGLGEVKAQNAFEQMLARKR